MLIRPITPRRIAIACVASSTWRSMSGPSDIAGITQAESPECTPASSTCCMIAADPRLGPVAERVHVHLDRVLEEAVQEDRPGAVAVLGALQVVRERLAGVTDLHGAAAEHVARAHQQRVADVVRGAERLARGRGGGIRRAVQPQLVQQRPEAGPVLGEVDRLDRRPEQRHARGGEVGGELATWSPARSSIAVRNSGHSMTFGPISRKTVDCASCPTAKRS